MDERESSTAYTVVVGALYVVAVGIQVYAVVDALSDGGLTREVQAKWARARARFNERRRVESEYRAYLPWVRWDIHQLEDEVNREP